MSYFPKLKQAIFVVLCNILCVFHATAETCPAAPAEAFRTGIIVNELNNDIGWVEFYIPPNVTVDFNQWTLEQNGPGSNDDTFTICSSACEFSGGSDGIFVTYGNNPTGASADILNNSYSLHNTTQEIVLLDGSLNSGELVHYLNYANNDNQNGNFDYLSCATDYPELATEVRENGAQGHCASVDGETDEQVWSSCTDSTPGTTNDNGPTDIVLDNNMIVEYKAYAGADIGSLGATDSDAADSHDFVLFWEDANTDAGSCAEDFQDNSNFQIVGGQLQIVNTLFSTLEVRTYTICVKATDSTNQTYRKNLTIEIEATPEDANFFDITSSTVMDINAAVGDSIGDFFATDDGEDLNLTYDIAYGDVNAIGSCSGDYDNNNWKFDIVGTSLQVLNTSGASNLPSGNYEICVRATDSDTGITFIKDFTIGVLSLSCQDTSSYSSLFSDDFSTTDNDWDTVDLDRNSINLWPGENIFTNAENLFVQYLVQNGQLDINGAITADGDNEYGMVLHDLIDQFVDDTQVQTYNITASLIANSDGANNNDAGLVFGYMDGNNFYLLRWTKFAEDYENDVTFPGEYRSLDLIRVENGETTILASQSDFYVDDPIPLNVTVNERGVTACVDGFAAIADVEARPAIGKVGFYSYDNDVGVSFDDFEVLCGDCSVENIIGWWPMEGDFTDLAQENDLAVIGSPTFSTDDIAKTLDGTDNSTCEYAEFDGFTYGQVADSGQLNSNELTVSAWVYPTSYPRDSNDVNGGDSLMSISSKDENYEFHINSSGRLFWWWRNENRRARSLTSNISILLNEWSHVAITYRPGQQSMYINGVVVASNNYNENPFSSECDYYIGADVDTSRCALMPRRTFIGNLDEVRIYQAYKTQQEIVDDANLLRSCALVDPVHHYEIIHNSTGVTCLAETPTVVACGDATCSTKLGREVTGYLTVDATNDQLLPLSFSMGLQELSFYNTTAETVQLGLSSMSPDALSDTVCSYSNCEIDFSEQGYYIEIDRGDFESATGFQPVTVTAVTDSGNSSPSCDPDFVGSQPLVIDFNYITPNLVNVPDLDQQNMGYSLDDTGEDASIQSGVGHQTTLTFDATNAQSSFHIAYEDVGQVSLNIYNQGDSSIAGNRSFVVYPSALEISMSDSDDNILNDSSSGHLTHTAGEPFNLNITAVNALGNITENYRPGDMQVTSIMEAPKLVAGANNVSFNYDGSNAVTLSDANDWNSLSLTFDGTGYNSQDASFDNVGTFSVNSQDIDYFGYTINTSGAVSAGRFIPYYYDISQLTQGSIAETMTGAAYIGETLNFNETPSIEIIARAYDGSITTNYQGSSFAAIDLLNRTYTEQAGVTIFNGGDTSSGNVTISDNTDFDGSFIVNISGDTFTYLKDETPLGPFNSQIDLTLTAADLTDDDGVGYCSGDNAASCPITFEPYEVAFSAQPEMRYGRLAMDNALGPDDIDIRLNLTLEYYDGTRFVTNTSDSITDFSGLLGDITVAAGIESYALTVLNSSSSLFNNGEIESPDGLYIGAQGEAAEIILELNNVPTYLQFDWDDDGTLDSPSSTILFGRYRGNDRIIYKRER